MSGLQRIDRFGAVLAVFFYVMTGTAQAQTVTVFAASSLRDAVGEIAQHHKAETGGEVVLVFAASSTIARQIAQGAPADVVLLADQAWSDWLIEEGALTDAVPFAANRLVLMSADPMAITGAGDIVPSLGDGNLAMAQVDAVPAGRYGRAALIELGLWDDVEPQVVQAANVRAALRLVERREAVMGIGYLSDLVALPDLYALFEFGMDAPPVAIYSGGSLTPQGADFMTYMTGETTQNTLREWGFLPPPELQ